MNFSEIKASITVKMIGFMLAISVLPLLVFQVLSYLATQQTIIAIATQHSGQLLGNQRDYLYLQTDQIDNFADNPAWVGELKRLQGVADRHAGFRAIDDDLAMKARIGQLFSGYGGLGGLDSIDLYTIQGAHYHLGEAREDSAESSAWIKTMMAAAPSSRNRTVWFGVEKSTKRGLGSGKAIIAAKTIFQANPTGPNAIRLGVLRMNFSTGFLHDHFRSLNLGLGSYLLLVDAQQRLLFHPDVDLIGQPIGDDVSQVLKGPSGALPIRLNGEDVLFSYLQIPDKKWYMLSIVPQSTLTAPMSGLVWKDALLLSVCLLLIGLFGRTYVRKVIHPIGAVTDGFRQFQAHRLDPSWRLAISSAWAQIGELVTWFNSFLDTMQARREAEASLSIAATAFESQLGVTVTDTELVILRVNKAFTEITGYSSADVVGKTPRLLQSGHHDAAFYEAMWEDIRGKGSWEGEIWNRRKNGEVFPEWITITAVKDNAGATTHYVATFVDITQRKAAEEQIKNLAYYDPLTHLPNRRLLMDRLGKAVAAGSRHQRKGALLFVDLDNFKTLNDTLGHVRGDSLLQQVAQRLCSCLRDVDTVARLGGDEFVVMLEDMSESSLEAATQAEAVGEKILAALSQPYQLDQLDQSEYRSTASIGITLYGGQNEDLDEPLKRGDLAMYQAKSAGRNTLRFFDPQMQAEVMARAAMESSLHEAIQRSQLVLFYQPQVTGQGFVTGAEALVRWKHPLRGIVSPCEFIPLAESTGLILPLGQWVMETACSQLTLWAGMRETQGLTLAVNVSPKQFYERDFVAQVLAVLERTGANPRRLKLELTESLLVANIEDTIFKMLALKEKGVGFSLDDFGTGYSSLAYLKRLPLDQLKIDQSFVKDLLTDPNDAAIAKMVIILAESLGLSVIAEGVETSEQMAFLAGEGCHSYQGYLFSRPVPTEEFVDFVISKFTRLV